MKIELRMLTESKQDVREAYAYFFSAQECDPITVLV